MAPIQSPDTATTVTRTLVLTDIVSSTALAAALGVPAMSALMHRVDRCVRDLVERHGGLEIDKTDGFLLLFDTPEAALKFAADLHGALEGVRSVRGPVEMRVGVHTGAVTLHRNNARDVERGAKPIEVEGLAKPIAARVMSLARGGQTLVSDDKEAPWRYRLAGVPEPVGIREFVPKGRRPIGPPPDGLKAWRAAAGPLAKPREALRRALAQPINRAVLGSVLIAGVAAAVWTWDQNRAKVVFADDVAIRFGEPQPRHIVDAVVAAQRVRVWRFETGGGRVHTVRRVNHRGSPVVVAIDGSLGLPEGTCGLSIPCASGVDVHWDAEGQVTGWDFVGPSGGVLEQRHYTRQDGREVARATTPTGSPTPSGIDLFWADATGWGRLCTLDDDGACVRAEALRIDGSTRLGPVVTVEATELETVVRPLDAGGAAVDRALGSVLRRARRVRDDGVLDLTTSVQDAHDRPFSTSRGYQAVVVTHRAGALDVKFQGTTPTDTGALPLLPWAEPSTPAHRGGCARWTLILTSPSELLRHCYHGDGEQLGPDARGVATYRMQLDDRGYPTTVRFEDPEGEAMTLADGETASYELAFEQGRWTSWTSLTLAHEPIGGGIARRTRAFEADTLTEIASFGAGLQPAIETVRTSNNDFWVMAMANRDPGQPGCAVTRYALHDDGFVHRACLGVDGEPAEDSFGVSIRAQRVHGDEVVDRIFRKDGSPAVHPLRGFETHTRLGPTGQRPARVATFDTEGRAWKGAQGSHAIEMKWTQGRLAEQSFFNRLGEPVLLKFRPMSKVRLLYDRRMNLIARQYFDADGRQLPDERGVVQVQGPVDGHGYPVRQRFLDATGAQAELNGCASVLTERDEFGDAVRERCRDRNDKPAPATRWGGATDRMLVRDPNGDIVEERYLDATGSPRPGPDEWSAKRTVYTAGRVTGVRFLGPDGQPFVDDVGVAGWDRILDDYGVSEEHFMGSAGQAVANAHGVAVVRWRRDEFGRLVEVRYEGLDGELVALGPARVRHHFQGAHPVGRDAWTWDDRPAELPDRPAVHSERTTFRGDFALGRLVLGVDGVGRLLPGGVAGWTADRSMDGRLHGMGLVDAHGEPRAAVEDVYVPADSYKRHQRGVDFVRGTARVDLLVGWHGYNERESWRGPHNRPVADADGCFAITRSWHRDGVGEGCVHEARQAD